MMHAQTDIHTFLKMMYVNVLLCYLFLDTYNHFFFHINLNSTYVKLTFVLYV